MKLKIILILIGTVLLGLAVMTGLQSKKLSGDGIKVPGKVVRFDIKRKTEKKKETKMYYPIVSFKDADGLPQEFKSNTGSNPQSYNTGEMVEVIYKKGNSSAARINSFTSMWLLPLILSIFGFVLFGIGLAVPK